MNTLEEAFVNIGMDEEKFMKETRRYSDLAPLDPHQQNIEIDKVQPSEFNDFSAIVAPECVKKSPNYSFSLQFIGCLLRRVYVLRGKRVACGLVLPSALIILGSAITLSNRDEGWESSAAITLANLVVIAFAMQSGSGSIALIMER
jgi:ATP-binding cassette subfamily A (ABC1) protein 3